MFTRRSAIETIATATTIAALSGCKTTTIGAALCQPVNESGVDWLLPDVARPVHFGVTDGRPTFLAARVRGASAAVGGPPRPMLIYYPSAELTGARRMLRPCIGRFPLVMFYHGHHGGIGQANYNEKWRRICSTIASCGYVVAAPVHIPTLVPEDAALAAVARDVAWLRNEWWGAQWLDARPDSTSYIGHSYGALLACRAVTELPAAAFVSLGGVFLSSELQYRLKELTIPAFYAYVDGNSNGAFDEHLNVAWPGLSIPKWRAVYFGEHFDYLDPADTTAVPRGPSCPEFPQVMADLVTLFLGATFMSRTPVSYNLERPSVALAPQQQLFASDHFAALKAFEQSRSCAISLSWETSLEHGAGTRKIGRGADPH